MVPKFDKNGLALQAGYIRVYYFSRITHEYAGWSDEFINIGISIPDNSTPIAPKNTNCNMVSVFNKGYWEIREDHRGVTVYSTDDGHAEQISYIGSVRDGFTMLSPITEFDMWDGEKWITDINKQHDTNICKATEYKKSLIDNAIHSINLIQLKLNTSRQLSDVEKKHLDITLDYINTITEIDISKAPDITWPAPLIID